MKKVKATLLSKDNFNKTVTRLVHEIIENNSEISNIAIIGIRTRGEYLAQRIASKISNQKNRTLYRVSTHFG